MTQMTRMQRRVSSQTCLPHTDLRASLDFTRRFVGLINLYAQGIPALPCVKNNRRSSRRLSFRNAIPEFSFYPQIFYLPPRSVKDGW